MYDKFRALLTEAHCGGICNQMKADERFYSIKSTLVRKNYDSFPYVTRKTMPLDIFKPYTNAELCELIKEEHLLKKKRKGNTFQTQANSRPKLFWKMLNHAL